MPKPDTCSSCAQPTARGHYYCPWCGTKRRNEGDDALANRSKSAWDHLERHDSNCQTCKDALKSETYPADFGDRCPPGERLEAIAFLLDRQVGAA